MTSSTKAKLKKSDCQTNKNKDFKVTVKNILFLKSFIRCNIALDMLHKNRNLHLSQSQMTDTG